MKKEAINTFSEGLITDISPISSQNNTLSYCLNGTFITYNGNEFVLQNEMGNSKIEYAKLPNGYIPIGIKEHGGIIYVASYNPISKKGQVGSFPSPQRNFTPDENETDNTLTKSSFNNNYNPVKIPLNIDGSVLNIGDEFAIQISKGSAYTDSIFKIIQDIVPNETGLIKLKLATLSKNGELIYIDSTITPKPSQLDINNSTVQVSYWATINEDINDETLNRYNVRSSGQLFVIAELQVLDSYVLTLTKEIDNNTYKCTFDNEVTNSDLWKYLKLVYSRNGDDPTTEYIIKSSDPLSFEISTNDPNDYFTYECTPCLIYGEQPLLTKKGRINFSNFNQDYLTLNNFSYQKVDNNLDLNIGVDFNTTIDESIDRLELEFYNLNKLNKYKHVCSERDFKSINFTETIPVYDMDNAVWINNTVNVSEAIWTSSTGPIVATPMPTPSTRPIVATPISTPSTRPIVVNPIGLDIDCLYLVSFNFYKKDSAGLVLTTPIKEYRFVYTNELFNKHFLNTVDIVNEYIDFNANLSVDLIPRFRPTTKLLRSGLLPYCFNLSETTFDSVCIEQKEIEFLPRVKFTTDQFDKLTVNLNPDNYILKSDDSQYPAKLYDLVTFGNQNLETSENRNLTNTTVFGVNTYQYIGTPNIDNDTYLQIQHETESNGKVKSTKIKSNCRSHFKSDVKTTQLTKNLKHIKSYFSQENLEKIFGVPLPISNNKWISYRWGINGTSSNGFIENELYLIDWTPNANTHGGTYTSFYSTSFINNSNKPAIDKKIDLEYQNKFNGNVPSMRILSGVNNGLKSNILNYDDDWCILDMKTTYMNNVLVDIYDTNTTPDQNSIFSKLNDYFGNLYVSQKEFINKSLLVSDNAGGVESYKLSCPIKYKFEQSSVQSPIVIKLRDLQIDVEKDNTHVVLNRGIPSLIKNTWSNEFTDDVLQSINYNNLISNLSYGDHIIDYDYVVDSPNVQDLKNMYLDPENNYPDILHIGIDDHWKIYTAYDDVLNTSKLQDGIIYYRSGSGDLLEAKFGTRVYLGINPVKIINSFCFKCNYNPALDFNEILIDPINLNSSNFKLSKLFNNISLPFVNLNKYSI